MNTNRRIVTLFLCVAVLFCAQATVRAQTLVSITPEGNGPSLAASGADFVLPVPNPSASIYDLWWDDVGNGDLFMCALGNLADEIIGSQVYFYGAAMGGGWTQAGITVYYLGVPYHTFPDYWVNSPDMTGDLQVNLVDIGLFAGDFGSGTYHYRSDFTSDGLLNLADIGRFAIHNGEACP